MGLVRTCACVVVMFVVAASAQAQDRPRVLLSRDELPRVRDALEGDLAPVATAITRGIDAAYEGSFPRTPDASWEYFSDPRAIGDSLFAFAFAALVWGDDGDERARRAVELARAYLVGICGYGDWVFASRQDGPAPDLYSAHFLMDVAVAYDWLHARLSDAERATCRTAIAREGRKMYEAAIGGAWWVEDRIQNHHWINHAGLGIAAIAMHGEIDADTAAWRRAADSALANAQRAMDLVEGGAWHEGCGYASYGLEALVIHGVASRRADGTDYADAALLRDLPSMRAMTMPPALAHRREFPLWGDFSGFTNDSTIALAAHRMRFGGDRLAAWYARRFLEGGGGGRTGITTWPPSQRGPIMAAILWDASIAPEAPRALDHFAADLSLFTTRSGWDEDDAVVVLKNGPFGGHGNFARVRDGGEAEGTINYGHDHADDLGVQMFGDGEWLTVPVPGYWIGRANGDPEANRTRFASSILIDGLGQLGEGVRRGSSAADDARAWFWDRIGTIPSHGGTAHHAFARADGTALYPASRGMELVERVLVHADREVVLVRDRVRSSVSHRYEVVWHAIDAAARDGSWLRLEAKNGRALGVRVLAPASFETTTEVQTARNVQRFDADGQLTAVMVRPASDASAHTFLHALVPVRTAAWSSRPTIDTIDGDRGARFGDTRVVFESADRIEHDGVAAVVGPARAAILAGSSLVVDGIARIEVLDGAPASVEVETRAGAIDLSGDRATVRVYAPDATRVTREGVEVAHERDGDHVVVGAGAEPEEDGGMQNDGGIAQESDGGVGADAGAPTTPGRESLGGGCACGVAGAPASRGGVAMAALGVLAMCVASRRKWALAAVAALAIGCAGGDGDEPRERLDGGATTRDASAIDARGDDDDDASVAVDTDAGSDDERDAGDVDPGDAATSDDVDCFGTRNIYPTIAGGREWCLPSDPTRPSGAWDPHDDAVGAGSEPGTLLSDGSPRHSVTSLEGDAWWRNVEMTVYLRWLEGDAGEEFTFYARGERHSDGMVSMSEINEGVEAPPGTVTWPGYPFSRAVPQPCLGSAYKGSLAVDGSAFFKKEISHTGGYTNAAGEETVFADGLPRGEWVGFKFVLQNDGDGVHMEIWVDREADGHWERATFHDDRGGWNGDPQEDGCDAAPLSYERDQIVDWAGPIAVLRADLQRFELRAFTVREIAPLR
ncbi:DUF4962 domain-containing protein [Sandaracinus amylolyticus]|uniref:F5/8 type C domain protein n=1 Tax=Sandaracinus amylolyticus TaxID=927083 RepID=A0A0F6SD90_9BACT|nr:DUF4962 domain-containing protein [Sandaracinus amylolyticus]AKF03029.1 F5/8 type C domain protein [Sandaracinus amylolyticus]